MCSVNSCKDLIVAGYVSQYVHFIAFLVLFLVGIMH